MHSPIAANLFPPFTYFHYLPGPALLLGHHSILPFLLLCVPTSFHRKSTRTRTHAHTFLLRSISLTVPQLEDRRAANLLNYKHTTQGKKSLLRGRAHATDIALVTCSDHNAEMSVPGIDEVNSVAAPTSLEPMCVLNEGIPLSKSQFPR